MRIVPCVRYLKTNAETAAGAEFFAELLTADRENLRHIGVRSLI